MSLLTTPTATMLDVKEKNVVVEEVDVSDSELNSAAIGQWVFPDNCSYYAYS